MIKKSANGTQKDNTLPIPDIEIIDLESGNVIPPKTNTTVSSARPGSGTASARNDGRKKKGRSSFLNIHVILLAVTVLFIAGILYKVLNYGVHVDLDEIFKDGPGTYEDNFDTILPLFDAEGNPVYKNYGEGSTILAFGNAPFADDRDSEDNLANMIQQMTGATVINCSVSGSYLAADGTSLNPEEHPMDIFNFYWLCCLITDYFGNSKEQFQKGMEVLGDNAPPEAWDVYNTLTTIDMSTVDAVVVMYDGSDYLAGHAMYSDSNSTDVTQFTGNTEAGIEMLHFSFPETRIIVMSPTYAYGLDENGNYVSSDIQRYGWDVLSTYVIKQYASCSARMVTFVDNLYGTINEDQADEYLTDHLHLNIAGRKKVAERFAYALNYFSDQAE